MFVDLATLTIEAGKGGDGLISFRREKFVAKGGPNGGNGGQGGSVIFKADQTEYDLSQFRFKKLIKAGNGQAGGSNNRQGKTGQDRVIKVPVGTLITDLKTDRVIADLIENQQEVIVAIGGSGGFGNAHFKSSNQQIPLVAEKGLKGQKCQIQVELKLLAEVGLIGLPNSGKSTFLRSVTKARPKIGAYPFTTLEPYLGVTANQCLIADIPGLIEGAAEGKGLGHQFLRHVERNLVLLHLIDCQNNDPKLGYNQIISELEKYNPALLELPQIVALTKIELVDNKFLNQQTKALQSILRSNHQLHRISALAHLNLEPLLTDLKNLINRQKQILAQQSIQSTSEDMVVFRLDDKDKFEITRLNKQTFQVLGQKIENFALKTDFNNYHARSRLRNIMTKLGITKQLLRQNYKDERIVFGIEEVGDLYLDEIIESHNQHDKVK
ncbi:MAG: GTPase ObgE [Candidatus Saccharibacteria bacterium]|nr:GTPase ObgE [Candidatus Saccharibacteria bacterium]